MHNDSEEDGGAEEGSIESGEEEEVQGKEEMQWKEARSK